MPFKIKELKGIKGDATLFCKESASLKSKSFYFKITDLPEP